MSSRTISPNTVPSDQPDVMPDADRDAFLTAMAQAVTGVSVVTTDGASGPIGATVSAIASISAEPPLIMACIRRTSAITNAIHINGSFCINLLAAGQHPLSDRFSGRSGTDRGFNADEGAWQATASGALRLAGAVASFDCVLWTAHEAGSHTMFVGRVVGVSCGDQAALTYSQRRYGRSVPLAPLS